MGFVCAFSTAFRFACWVLVIGVLIGLLAGTQADQPVTSDATTVASCEEGR
jgi:hypothetical protein